MIIFKLNEPRSRKTWTRYFSFDIKYMHAYHMSIFGCQVGTRSKETWTRYISSGKHACMLATCPFLDAKLVNP